MGPQRVCTVHSGRVNASPAPAAPTDLQLQQQTLEQCERQTIPPSGLAPGIPFSFPDASWCSEFDRAHLSTSLAQLRLRPAGPRGATSPTPTPSPGCGLKRPRAADNNRARTILPGDFSLSTRRQRRGLRFQAPRSARSSAERMAEHRPAFLPPSARAQCPHVLGEVLALRSGRVKSRPWDFSKLQV